MADNPYVRVHHRIVDDPRFAEIHGDDAAFAAYVRLKIIADACWPASAPLPRRVNKAALAKLVKTGLTDLVPGDRYRMPEIDTERAERSKNARNAAASRWGDAGASRPHMQPHDERNAESMPSKAEQRLAKPNKASLAREGHPSDRPPLKADQLDEWVAFERPEWQPFREAWLGRGFRWPPNGSIDEEGSQRALLWTIARERPNDLGAWVAEASGPSAHEVVGHVLRRWDAHKRTAESSDELPQTVPAPPRRIGEPASAGGRRADERHARPFSDRGLQ